MPYRDVFCLTDDTNFCIIINRIYETFYVSAEEENSDILVT
jgi:hypothetical protein